MMAFCQYTIFSQYLSGIVTSEFAFNGVCSGQSASRGSPSCCGFSDVLPTIFVLYWNHLQSEALL